MHRVFTATIAIAIAAMPAQATSARAGDGVALTSAVFVERQVARDGRSRTVLETPRTVSRGDSLVFVVNYSGPARGGAQLVVTNPLPDAVAFRSTADRGASVSVDGGRSWGQLDALRLRDADGGMRGARPEDVTHVRWTVPRPADAPARGTLSFRGTVR